MISVYRKIYRRIVRRVILSYSFLSFLPTSPTDSQVLDYSGMGLTSDQVDAVINKLYNDGYVTNCTIDLSDNAAPTAESSAELAGLREITGMNNTVAID